MHFSYVITGNSKPMGYLIIRFLAKYKMYAHPLFNCNLPVNRGKEEMRSNSNILWFALEFLIVANGTQCGFRGRS